MEIIILILWLAMGVLSHMKFHGVARRASELDLIDTLGIFLIYLLAPWWVVCAIFKYIIVGKWD